MFMCRIISRIYDVIWSWPHDVCDALYWAATDSHYVPIRWAKKITEAIQSRK